MEKFVLKVYTLTHNKNTNTILQEICSSPHIMRKGITYLDKNIRPEESQTHRHSLDLINSRLNIPSNKYKKHVAGSGDNQLTQTNFHNTSLTQTLARLNLEQPSYQRRSQGYRPYSIQCKSKTTQTRLSNTSSIDEFLLRPKKTDPKEIYPTRSAFRLNSSGDIRNFPFKVTRSGNLKVNSEQVVFESKKISVLVANPDQTEVKVYSDNSSEVTRGRMNYDPNEFCKNSAMDKILSQAGIPALHTIIGDSPVRRANKVPPEYASKPTSEILDPELNLSRLGYTGNQPIDWKKANLPDKRELYLELGKRVADRKNADCKVLIGNEEFSCHLIVLQCYSELFDGYVAIKKVEIPAEKCSPASFNFIYRWMISEMDSFKYINRKNVLDIFNSAKYLRIKDLVEQCWAFVDNLEIFNEDTAFLLYVDAKNKDVDEVRELMIPRIQEFFLTLVSSQDWLELTVQDVKILLNSNYIMINCEMEVFMAGVRWLKYDWDNRYQYRYEVINCVRFGNIAPWQLVDIKRNQENPDFTELAKDPDICKLIDDGLAYVIIKYWYGQDNEDFQHWNSVLGLREPHSRNWTGSDKHYFTYREFVIFLDQYRRNQLIEKGIPRGCHLNDDLIPGASSHSGEIVPSMEDFMTKKRVDPEPEQITMQPVIAYPFLKKIVKIVNEDEESKNIKNMFTPSQDSLALSSLNRLSTSFLSAQPRKLLTESSLFLAERETILIFGGANPYFPLGEPNNTGNNIFRYLPDSNEWEHVGTMPEPRHHHGIGFLKGRIYLAGGTDPRDDNLRGKSRVVDTVWSFDPANRCWFSETSLCMRRRNFGMVVIQQNMYAIGGCNDQSTSLATVEKFDAKLGVWKFVAPMKYARAGIACARYRNFIWAAGGTADLKRNFILDVVESYNIKVNQWTTIRKLNSPRCFTCLFVMSDNLYIIGGTGQKFREFKTTYSIPYVDMWDTSSMSWKTIMELTIPRHGHAVAYIGTQIFIMGGVTTIYMRCLSNVECFCLRRGAWVRGITELPIALSGHAAITLPPAMLISSE